MNLNFRADWLGLISGVLILLKVFVPHFVLDWVWVLSPLWGVAGFVCACGLLSMLLNAPVRRRR